jgi:sec-independent protein translocase protein TatC
MLSHLLELRQRLLIILITFLCCFLLCFLNASRLYHIIAMPLLLALPKTSTIIATAITAPVVIPLTLAANLALLCTMPMIFFQLWRFMAPGLYHQEQRQLYWLMLLGFLLFSLGMLFCFYFVLPFMFQLFIQALPKEVRLMPDMSTSLEFIIHMLFLFGWCFQVPLICILLTKFNWLTVNTLRLARPYVIVAAFIVGMLLTPPDVLSQVMLAIPLCLLYELGIFFARFLT